jgi:uncharacterized protein
MSKWLLIFLITFASAQANTAEKLIAEARKQIGVTVRYDPAYVSLTYPKGDIPRERGVCTDVVIRALRDALDKDLQELVHLDMKANFSKYPKIWGLKSTDKNIDHRRVPNLMTFFTRKHIFIPLPKGDAKSDFQPGDIVTCTVAKTLPHIMIVSDKKNASGRPLIIHNIGSGTEEEDRIDEFPITGHYRWKD